MHADCVIHSPLASLVYGEEPEADLDTTRPQLVALRVRRAQ